MSTIEQRFASIEAEIQKLCDQYSRDRDEITLLAVSKTQSTDAIKTAHRTGQRAFGENYLQEACDKAEQLQGSGIQWHFIGPLQSNKTRLAAASMDWVQTVDRLKIGQRLNDQRPAELPALNILVQVNISREPQKSGVLPEQLPELLTQLSKLERLKLRGLMAIPAASDSLAEQRKAFAALRSLYDEHAQNYGFDCLSMGMSGDMEAAIAEGTTMLRIGTALFGPRQR